MSALLTSVMCDTAWNAVSVAVDAAHEDGIIKRMAGTIVVLDPTLPYNDTLHASNHALFKANISDNDPSAEKYEEIATAKAQLSWRTGRSSRDVQQNAPHLYREPRNRVPGDVKWGGSVVREGLIVAFSGVEAVYDEWIAGMMADLLIAMCRHEMTKPGGVMESPGSFIDDSNEGVRSSLRVE